METKKQQNIQYIFDKKKLLEQKIQRIPEKRINPLEIIQYMYIHDYSVTDKINNDVLRTLEKLIILYERYVHSDHPYPPLDETVKKMEKIYWNELKMELIRDINAKVNYLFKQISDPNKIQETLAKIGEIRYILNNIQECLDKL